MVFNQLNMVIPKKLPDHLLLFNVAGRIEELIDDNIFTHISSYEEQ